MIATVKKSTKPGITIIEKAMILELLHGILLNNLAVFSFDGVGEKLSILDLINPVISLGLAH